MKPNKETYFNLPDVGLDEAYEEIKASLDKRTLLEQLAEESAELSQASAKIGQYALKYLRASNLNKSPTPMDQGLAHSLLDSAIDDLLEELADVSILLSMLDLIEGPIHKARAWQIEQTAVSKTRRWHDRLRKRGQ